MIRRRICRQNCKEKVFLFIAEKDTGYPRRNESGLPPLKDVFYRGILRLRKESVSQGLRPFLWLGFKVRTKVRTYLRSNNNGNCPGLKPFLVRPKGRCYSERQKQQQNCRSLDVERDTNICGELCVRRAPRVSDFAMRLEHFSRYGCGDGANVLVEKGPAASVGQNVSGSFDCAAQDDDSEVVLYKNWQAL